MLSESSWTNKKPGLKWVYIQTLLKVATFLELPEDEQCCRGKLLKLPADPFTRHKQLKYKTNAQHKDFLPSEKAVNPIRLHLTVSSKATKWRGALLVCAITTDPVHSTWWPCSAAGAPFSRRTSTEWQVTHHPTSNTVLSCSLEKQQQHASIS